MADSNLKIIPTLVIGIGGTGTNVVRLVKRRFLRTWNDSIQRQQKESGHPPEDLQEDLPSVLHVLSVDTEPLTNRPDEEPLYPHEFAYMGRFDATLLVHNKDNHKPYLDWWTWGDRELPLGYIHSGARQLRPLGRLSYVRNYPVFRTMLDRKLRSLEVKRDVKHIQELGFGVDPGGPVQVYIVASLCGGTGAGMFLDLAHTVRHYVMDSKLLNVDVMGVFLLPSVFLNEVKSTVQQRRIQANAYAALKELDYFHRNQGFQSYYPGEQGPIPAIKERRAFDRIFLIERMDELGASLSSKAAAEQMVAQYIHLTAFSHLNQRIKGQESNATATEESDPRNMGGDVEGSGAPGRGAEATEAEGPEAASLAYSSFGVSSLVIQRQALWRFFVARATEMVIEQFLAGQVDRDAAWATYLVLVQRINQLYNQYQGSSKGLDLLAKSIDKADSVDWAQFEKALEDAASETLSEQGIAGFSLLLEWLTYDDKHPNCTDEMLPRSGPRAQVARFGPFDLINYRSIAERLLQRPRETTWARLVSSISTTAKEWLSEANNLTRHSDEIMRAVKAERWQAARQVHPLYQTGDRETSTIYDMETGAMGLDQLNGFWERAERLITRPMLRDLFSELYAILLEAGGTATPDLRRAVASYLSSQPGLRDRVDRVIDLRHIMHIQQSNGTLPPNHRMNQLFESTRPHVIVDGDTHGYQASQQDQILLVTRPPRPGNQSSQSSADASAEDGVLDPVIEQEYEKAFEHILDGHSEFESVEGNDLDRVDAVHVIHGLPVGQISSIPSMRRQYDNPQFRKRTLHIDPKYADETTYPPPRAMRGAENPQWGETSNNGGGAPPPVYSPGQGQPGTAPPPLTPNPGHPGY